MKVDTLPSGRFRNRVQRNHRSVSRTFPTREEAEAYGDLIVQTKRTAQARVLLGIVPPRFAGVYFLACEAPSGALAIKIGWSHTSIAQRISDLRRVLPWESKLLAVIRGASETTERELHAQFRHHRITSCQGIEWFHGHPEILRYIHGLGKSAQK